MKVDLIVPEFPPAHWNFAFAMDVEGSKYSHPPVGVATLAAYTPEGWRVRILDENVEPIRIDELADTVGISAMYIQRKRTFELARRIRATGRRVVIGGGLTSALPEQCAAEADVVFHGEGELTWPQFLNDVRDGNVQKEYRAAERFDLQQSRMPRYDLLNMQAYSTASIQTSRGCPYACDYCDVPSIDGSRPRTKPIELVMREVETLYASGQRSFFFVDDHFLGNKKYAMQLVAELTKFVEREHHRPIFYCQATLNIARDDEALEALYRANFRRLFIGIESDDLTALENVNKAHNTSMPVAEAVKRIQRWNITVWAALLAGFDEDGPEVFERYQRFVREAKLGMIIPGLLQAVPGTKYHEKIASEGRLIQLKNRYVGGQSGSLDSLLVTNVKPKRVTSEALIAGYRRFVRGIYEYDAFADRLISAMDAGTEPELGKATPADVWEARHILKRAIRWYMTGPADRRAFFLRVMGHLAKRKLRRVDETLFHLVLYKHLREFYFTTSDASVPVADDLTAEPMSPAPSAA
jgi:radical SAM superfamily enzyme YgiQ (UPF0313 family)